MVKPVGGESMTSTAPAAPEPPPSPGPDLDKAKAAIRGGTLAYFVDQFDIYLPIVVLAPAMAYFEPTTTSASTAALISSLVFVSTLLARPLGAVIFGHFADTVGRKRTTLVAVAGFGATTLLTACLPGHETIGGWSVGLLIALRFVDGIFLGGEYTTAVPLAMEWSPKEKRGLYASIITSTSPGAYVAIAALTLLLLQVIPSHGPHSAYQQWGWRIPFVIGALLAAGLYLYYRKQVHEPPATGASAPTGSKAPFLQLLLRHPKALVQVFVLMTGAWLATNMEAAATPAQLASHVHLDSTQVTLTMLVVNAAAAVSYPFYGVLSQRIGRRPFYIGYGIAVAVGGGGAYTLMTASEHSFGPVLGYGVALGLFTIGAYGPIAAYLTERFPSEIRSTGYGVGYSLALIAPAFYVFYQRQLAHVVPAHLSPAVLLVIAGALITLGGALGPETKDVDMGADRAAAHG
ncbi:MFS transporter [Streptomyces halstedii]|uniref:MFS transporter n=1 Tax=Streptomyces halstedii TaxID=1944 RepID=UPI0033AEF308